MDASVVVCSFNRCDSLAETLEALAAQQVPSTFEWQLVVVDNNSSDDTQGVLARFRERHPALEVVPVFEGRQGLSNARNAGIAASKGEFLAFTDDDVIPATDWLSTLIGNMRACGCHAAGGYISPIWQSPPPAWLTERFHGFLAIRQEAIGPRAIRNEEDLPFGANMAFRREVFDRIGRFDPTLGRSGTRLAGGEETDLMMRLIASGSSVMYFPDARVGHKVEAFRVRKRYFRRWRYQGSYATAVNSLPPEGRQIHGVPLYMFAQLARALGQAVSSRFTQPADEAFRQEIIVWHFLGLIMGGLHRAGRSSEA